MSDPQSLWVSTHYLTLVSPVYPQGNTISRQHGKWQDNTVKAQLKAGRIDNQKCPYCAQVQQGSLLFTSVTMPTSGRTYHLPRANPL